MRCFPMELVLRDLGDGRWYELFQDFRFAGKTRTIDVPQGFQTDFASIPRILWRLLPPSGSYNRAAVIHDWLYRTGRVSRREADELFLEAMEALGVPYLTRMTMYLAVRAFGRKHYKGNLK